MTRRSDARPDPAPTIESLAPAINFTIPLADRVRASAGPPACFIRKRRIEDLELTLLRALRDLLAGAGDARIARGAAARHKDIQRALAELASLVAAHNRYYPIEANLPMNPRTGRLMERGQAWTPLAEPSLDALLSLAARAEVP